MKKAKTQEGAKTQVTFQAYPVGSKVYAISRWHDNGPTDHLAIYQAQVDYYTYSTETGVSYELLSPSGTPWGCEVEAQYVSNNFNELLEAAKELWSNNNEDEAKKQISGYPF